MYSLHIKQSAVKLYQKFKSYRKVASIFNVSKSIIHKWVNKGYNFYYKRKRVHNIKLIASKINNILSNDHFSTIKHIKFTLHHKFNICISLSLIYLIIRKLGYTHKKVSNKLKSKNNNKKQINIFKKKIKKIPFSDIISIDESYIHINSKPYYGWSKDKRLIVYSYPNQIKFSILMAITKDGILDYVISTKSFNKQSFSSFIHKIRNNISGKKILMDNVSFHRSIDTINVIKHYNAEPLFIPPILSSI